jgi:predicted CoA-binding protein
MKINRGFMFGFAALFVAAMFTLAGCDDGGGGGDGSSKTLASIAITKQPAKTAYIVGESLDTAGMVVTATYSDGSTAAVTDWKTSGFDSSRAAASQTVTVSYTEGDVTKTATFSVTINPATSPAKTLASIAITTPPSKTAYTVGESLDTAGMVVTATYSDGSTAEVTGVPSGFDSRAAAASQTVTVSYTEGGVTKTATFSVTINAANPAKTLASIAITTPPSKTAYTVGEVLDLAGMVVTATYSDGSTAAVTDWTTSGFNSSAAAASQTVTVSYTEGGVTKTATFSITINPASGSTPGGGNGGQTKTLASIAITTQPAKTTYTVGESLDTTGMVVTATYSDGSTAAVTGWNTSGFDSSAAAASQTVTVSYTEGSVTKTATFSVTVSRGGVIITQPGSDDPILNVSEEQPEAGYSTSFTISVSSGYTVSKWILDGVDQTGTATFMVPVSTLADGNHSVTVIAVKDDKTYSATKTFKVHK